LVRGRAGEISIPTFVGRDLNEGLTTDEKSGGAKRDQRVIDSFKEALVECNLRDLNFLGH